MSKLTEQETRVVEGRIDGLKAELFASQFDLELIEGDDAIDEINKKAQVEGAQNRLKSAKSRLKLAEAKLAGGSSAS